MAIQVPTVYLPPFFGVTFGGGTNQGVIEAKTCSRVLPLVDAVYTEIPCLVRVRCEEPSWPVMPVMKARP